VFGVGFFFAALDVVGACPGGEFWRGVAEIVRDNCPQAVQGFESCFYRAAD
jgi:hypothetical protein